MESIWRKEEKTAADNSDTHRPAPESIHRDVIVVGGGIAGLLIAYYLKEAGKNVCVLEADEIASGQTERTTAKITGQHGLKYRTLIKKVGLNKAKLYAQANEDAVREYERFINNHHIPCRFEKVQSYLYTQQDVKMLFEEKDAANLVEINAYFTKETELPFEVEGALCFPDQAQFSPLDFVQYLASKLEIYEHTKVISVKENKVMTENAVMTADKIVIATHYPIKNIPGFYFLRQHQERSYVVALSGCHPVKGMYYSIDYGGLSFRQAGQYLLLGGGGHRTGKIRDKEGYECLMEAVGRYFPGSKIEACWSAQDCMPHDGIPFIGKYSIYTPDLYVATGFQKWGMTTSMIGAMILRDELCGHYNPYAKLFSPQRMNFRAGIGNLFTDIGESVRGLARGWFGKSLVQCTHMGCGLTWNEDEKTWDCPCHGSRFDAHGKLLDNPAKKNITM